MPTERSRPVWDERERPTTYYIDVHEEGRDYSVLPEADAGLHRDYLEWINAYKEQLHNSIRSESPKTIERLKRRGIDVAQIAQTVADITGRPVYPLSRIVTSSDLRSDQDYIDAAQAGFFKKAMKFGDKGMSYGDFEYNMHFIRLRQVYSERAAKLSVVDTLANTLGRAALAPVTYVHLDRHENGNTVYHWFGASWRYQDEYYGQMLDEASAAKVASLTRGSWAWCSPVMLLRLRRTASDQGFRTDR